MGLKDTVEICTNAQPGNIERLSTEDKVNNRRERTEECQIPRQLVCPHSFLVGHEARHSLDHCVSGGKSLIGDSRRSTVSVVLKVQLEIVSA